MTEAITSFDYEPSANKRWEGRGMDVDLDADPIDLMRIDPDNLEHELSLMGAITAWYSEKYADAVMAALLSDAELKRYTAQTYLTQRELLSQQARKTHIDLKIQGKGVLKLPSAATIDAAVRASPKYAELNKVHIMAEVEQVKLKGRCEAARRKAEALTAIGLKRNSEARALSAVGRIGA